MPCGAVAKEEVPLELIAISSARHAVPEEDPGQDPGDQND